VTGETCEAKQVLNGPDLGGWTRPSEDDEVGAPRPTNPSEEERTCTPIVETRAPAKRAADLVAMADGKIAHVGKVLLFVNLGYKKLDEGTRDLALGTSDMWSVDPGTGRVKIGGVAGLDMDGKDIANVRSIVSANGSWSIDESGVLTVEKVKTQELEVGSRAKPTGITIYDEVTGEPYCLRITNGATRTVPGECVVGAGTVNSEQAPVSSEPPPAELTPPPPPSEETAPPPSEPVVTADPAPAPEPAPPAPVSSDQQPVTSDSAVPPPSDATPASDSGT